MEDVDLFPSHPCPLARADNPIRCADARKSTPVRCARCKAGMARHLWDALHNGDRSLALMLMPSQLRDRGFSLEAHEGPRHAPVFELARDAAPGSVQDACFIVPEENGTRFEMLLVGEDDADYHIRQLTLDEAVTLTEEKGLRNTRSSSLPTPGPDQGQL